MLGIFNKNKNERYYLLLVKTKMKHYLYWQIELN